MNREILPSAVCGQPVIGGDDDGLVPSSYLKVRHVVDADPSGESLDQDRIEKRLRRNPLDRDGIEVLPGFPAGGDSPETAEEARLLSGSPSPLRSRSSSRVPRRPHRLRCFSIRMTARSSTSPTSLVFRCPRPAKSAQPGLGPRGRCLARARCHQLQSYGDEG